MYFYQFECMCCIENKGDCSSSQFSLCVCLSVYFLPFNHVACVSIKSDFILLTTNRYYVSVNTVIMNWSSPNRLALWEMCILLQRAEKIKRICHAASMEVKRYLSSTLQKMPCFKQYKL